MRNGQQTIIVKKQAKKDHGHGAGGAWKVAFADFTLAMMAFFMVMWIIASASTPELEKTSKAIRDHSIFDGTPNPFKFEGRGTPLSLEVDPDSLEQTASSMLSGSSSKSSFQDIVRNLDGESAPLVAAKEKVEQMAERLGAKDNISVEIVPQGLRIRLHDDQNRQMFALGNSNMSPFFEDLLIEMAPVFNELDNKMVISGHTDATPFNRNLYTNWELSGERAMTARQVLSVGGTNENRILQVSGMAERAPSNKENPNHSSNRRIELMILTKSAEQDLMAIFGNGSTYSDNSGIVKDAREAAIKNQPTTR